MLCTATHLPEESVSHQGLRLDLGLVRALLWLITFWTGLMFPHLCLVATQLELCLASSLCHLAFSLCFSLCGVHCHLVDSSVLNLSLLGIVCSSLELIFPFSQVTWK